MFCCWFTKLVDGFNALPGPVQKAIAITGGIVLALTAIATVMGVVLAKSWNGGFRDWRFRGCIRTLATSLGIAGGVAGLLRAGTSSNSFRCSTAVGVGVLAYKGYQKQLRTVLLL